MKNKKGFALILSIITILIVLILVGALFTSLITNADMIYRQNAAIKIYNVAEAGLARGLIQLRAGNSDRTPNTTAFSQTFSAFLDEPSAYSVTFTTLSPTSFRINSTGTYKTMSRTLSLEVFQESPAQWGFLTNQMNNFDDGNVWFYSSDYIDGPVHINENLNISGSPVFDGPVSVRKGVTYKHGGPPTDNPTFNGGISTNTMTNIPIPTATEMLLPIQTAAAQSGGLTLIGDTTIVFQGDSGLMNVTNALLVPNPKNIPLPTNGAIYVDKPKDFNISGVLTGKVTVGSSAGITIAGNLLYSGPRVGGLPTSPDNMLGLVAGGNVDISVALAPNNLEIDAYIVAPSGSLKFSSWASSPSGTLTIYGGVTQNKMGTVGGYTDSGIPTFTGYHKNYQYDSRLEYESPPYFTPFIETDGRIKYRKRLWQEVR